MRYVIRHHLRDLRLGREWYFVTELFRALIERLMAQYPAHTFDVVADPRYASYGYGSVHSCMHLSVWHPVTRRYILVSLFDNWRYHFLRSLGWEADRMTQFFYGGGFDFPDYFRFRRERHADADLAFPADIREVYRELPYVTHHVGLEAEMERLYLWPKRPAPNLLFRGRLWEPRKLMTHGLEGDGIVIVDSHAEGQRIEAVDYLTEMTNYAAVLSLPGGAPLCHREIEAFAVGVPVLSPRLPSNHADPLLPGVHYLACYHSPEWDLHGHPSYASYPDFRHHLLRTWKRVRDDQDLLAFVARNARAWYVRHCTMERQLERLLADLDLSTLD